MGLHLIRQGHDLRYVSRIFEDDHVMGIETYGSMVFSSMKQILNNVHDANILSGKSVFVRRFAHNIKHMMTPIPDRILWCYGEYQTLYGTVDGVVSLRSRVSKSGNPWLKSTPSTVPYKVWYSP
jgi:hypothetical protein